MAADIKPWTQDDDAALARFYVRRRRDIAWIAEQMARPQWQVEQHLNVLRGSEYWAGLVEAAKQAALTPSMASGEFNVPPDIVPWHCVEDIVLQLTNTREFYDDVQRTIWVSVSDALRKGRQERERRDLALATLVSTWLQRLFPGGVYHSGYGDDYKLSNTWITAVWREIRCYYTDDMPWNCNDDTRLLPVLEMWLRTDEARNLALCVKYGYYQRSERVPIDFVEAQIRKTWNCKSGNVLVAEYEQGQRRVLGSMDLRRLARLALEACEARSGISRELLDRCKISDYVVEEPSIVSKTNGSLDNTDAITNNKDSITEEWMNTAFDKEKVLETGKANLAGHRKLVNDVQAKACGAIQAYMNKVAAELSSTGNLKALKPLEIEVAQDVGKRYEDNLRMIDHIAGDSVPSSTEVTFLLADPADNTVITQKKVTVSVA